MSSNPQHSEGVESQPQATLCSGGCGFFANVGTSGLCSKCYRQTEQAQQKLDGLDAVAQKAAAAVSRPSVASVSVSSPAIAEAPPKEDTRPISPPGSAAPQPSAADVASEAPGGASPSAPPTRCTVECCRKRVGLTGFKCRCGHSFCGTHRHAESHNCTFDWKTFGRLQIAENNPTVQAQKVQRL